MRTPTELAEQLVTLLQARGLAATLGKPIEYGCTVLLGAGASQGQLNIYVKKNGVSSVHVQKPAVDNPEISNKVKSAWAELHAEEHRADSKGSAKAIDKIVLSAYVESLDQVVSTCQIAEVSLDWRDLSRELSWVANELGCEGVRIPTSLDEWISLKKALEAKLTEPGF